VKRQANACLVCSLLLVCKMRRFNCIILPSTSNWVPIRQWFPKLGSRPKKGSRRGDTYLGQKNRLLTLKMNLATFCQKNHFCVNIRCLRLRSRDVQQTQVWVALKKVWEPLYGTKVSSLWQNSSRFFAALMPKPRQRLKRL